LETITKKINGAVKRISCAKEPSGKSEVFCGPPSKSPRNALSPDIIL